MQIQSVVLNRAAYKREDFPRDGKPQFAIVGRSNVGKSSLINSILGRKDIARVSQTPGKTQAIHFYLINDRFYIVDLPGYGYANVSKATVSEWGVLVRSYLDGADDLQVIFLLLDCRRVPTDEDRQMIDWMRETDREWRAVLTKVDKLSGNQRPVSRRDIAAAVETDKSSLLMFSKITREGVEEMWREILPYTQTKGKTARTAGTR